MTPRSRFALSRLALSLLALAVLSLGAVSARAGLLDDLRKNLPAAVTGSGGGTSGGVAGLSTSEIVAGLREALKVGSERVVGQIGQTDGYFADQAIHIPLPESLTKVQSTLRKFGLSSMADDVEMRINRGAEQAAPKAKEIIWKAIEGMTLDDAQAIYNGPQDAATQYFRRVSTDDLTANVKPIVQQTLDEVGAIPAYDKLMGQYKGIPFVPDVKADLTQHATDGALEGLFHYLAQEEAAIRQNPAKRTTELLAKVFGR